MHTTTIILASFLGQALGMPISSSEAGPHYINQTNHHHHQSPQLESQHRLKPLERRRSPPPLSPPLRGNFTRTQWDATQEEEEDTIDADDVDTIFGHDVEYFNTPIDEEEWNLAYPPWFSSSSSPSPSSPDAMKEGGGVTPPTNDTTIAAVVPAAGLMVDHHERTERDTIDTKHVSRALRKKKCMGSKKKCKRPEKPSGVTPKEGKVPFWDLPLCYQTCVNEKAWDTWGRIGDIRELTINEYCHTKWVWTDRWLYNSLHFCTKQECKGCQPFCGRDSAIWYHQTCKY